MDAIYMCRYATVAFARFSENLFVIIGEFPANS